MAALESMVPIDLENHMKMNHSKFETYEEMREEIMTFLEGRTGEKIKDIVKRDKDIQDPKDVDSLGKGDRGKGKGK